MTKFLNRICQQLGVVIAALIATVIAPAAGRASIILSAGSDTVSVGDIFTIPISVGNALGLTSYQFDLSFNPANIEALSFDDSSTAFATEAVNEGGSLVGITGFIDNSTGLLSGVADAMSGNSGPGLTPAGTIADITFEALSPGISPLILSNAFLTEGGVPLSSANGDFVLQNGEIIVRGTAAVSESGTVQLLIGALGGVWLLRRPARLRGDKSGLQDSVS